MAHNFSPENRDNKQSWQTVQTIETLVGDGTVWLPRSLIEKPSALPEWVLSVRPDRLIAVQDGSEFRFAEKPIKPDTFNNGETAQAWSREVSRGVRPIFNDEKNKRRFALPFGFPKLSPS